MIYIELVYREHFLIRKKNHFPLQNRTIVHFDYFQNSKKYYTLCSYTTLFLSKVHYSTVMPRPCFKAGKNKVLPPNPNSQGITLKTLITLKINFANTCSSYEIICL